MRIAIIGGGAAGLVTAYLLHEAHTVTLVERQPQLGGNVRTLGGNVPCPGLPAGVRIDNGTLGFNPARYPNVMRLIAHLGVTTTPLRPGSAFLFADGTSVLTPSTRPEGIAFAQAIRRCLSSRTESPDAPPLDGSGIAAEAIARHLPSPFSRFGIALRGALMLAYSTPYDLVDELADDKALWLLDRLSPQTPWVTPASGVYSYMERMLERMNGTVRVLTGVEVTAVHRSAEGVRLEGAGVPQEAFDRVVFATTPDQVLRLLRDPTPDERERFGPWQALSFRTVAHHDEGLYARWAIEPYSVMDVFEVVDGRVGYNSAMVHLAGDRTYGFAHGLDGEIDPSKVLERFDHRVPWYSAAAVRTAAAIAADNGTHDTFHVGAYLGDGLHEGAVQSALAVSRQLGGQVL
jgi:predicted NAD/FAD-binding protein